MREEDGVEIGRPVSGAKEIVMRAGAVVEDKDFVVKLDKIARACAILHGYR
jgi:hypothetical protein